MSSPSNTWVEEENETEEHTFNILLATDIHLGYNEKNPIRGNDSFITFEEILNYGKQEEVDFVLLGGDLFHENKPSRRALQRCMNLLREYSLGHRETSFEFVSDPDVNFRGCATPMVNFEDPNINVALPIFSIHGNHDDPCGDGNFSVMDMLASSGFLNYFGKYQNLELLKFQPLLMQKGETRLAIYGIGSMNDDRIFRLFQEEKVVFEIPAEYEGSWFNILVLHQNRARHGSKNYVGEHLLPDFLDLVFWGHEHECRIEPEDFEDKFRITQPGSSIVTSLCPGEAVPKHVALLKVYRKAFRIEKLPLKTTRPFVFDTLSLSEFQDVEYQFASEEVTDLIRKKIEEMLAKAKELITGHPDQPTLPLLRLRIEHESDTQFISTRELEVQLGLEKKVANPDEVLKFVRKRSAKEKEDREVDEDAWEAVFNMETIDLGEGQLEDLLIQYFQETDKKPLLFMHERALAEGVRYYVDKEVDESFSNLIRGYASKLQEKLKDSKEVKRDLFRQNLQKLRAEVTDPQEIINEAHCWLNEDSCPPPSSAAVPVGISSEPRITQDIIIEDRVQRGRGRARRSRGPRTSSGTQRSSVNTSRVAANSDDEEMFIDDVGSPPRPSTSGRATRQRATRSRRQSGLLQAFARQSQSSMTTQLSKQNTSTTSSARGVCYISDSDSD